MPLSTWLVIHQGDASSATPFSTPASLNRDATPPLPPETFHLQHRKSSHIRRPPATTTHPATAAAEELMPRTSSLPWSHCSAPKWYWLMSHPHRSAIVTASPIPAAVLHHTTRLAFTPGGPHQSNFRRDPDGPHAHPSPPTSMCRSTSRAGRTGARAAASGGSGGADTTTPCRCTEEVAAFWYLLDGGERGCRWGASQGSDGSTIESLNRARVPPSPPIQERPTGACSDGVE
jgi:hypothetical protein